MIAPAPLAMKDLTLGVLMDNSVVRIAQYERIPRRFLSWCPADGSLPWGFNDTRTQVTGTGEEQDSGFLQSAEGKQERFG